MNSLADHISENPVFLLSLKVIESHSREFRAS